MKGLWQAGSLIGLTVPSNWTDSWDQGQVQLLGVTAQGSVDISTAQGDFFTATRLVLTPLTSAVFDPERNFYIGSPYGQPIFTDVTKDRDLVGVREALAYLPDIETELIVRAAAVVQFQANNRYCPNCGALTQSGAPNCWRVCPSCQTQHFPRIDPAIIVAVTDQHDRLLLGHNNAWAPNRYALFAGFVEAGESLEQAVIREVKEEVDLVVTNLRYAGSQPWPLPRSLMIGFTATSNDTQPHPDGQEITAVRWFDRSQLGNAIATGSISLPPDGSIGHRLISQWLGQP